MTITKEQLQYKLAGQDRHDYDAIMELLADREERIRALEARNTLNSEALQTQNGRACLAEDRERTAQERIRVLEAQLASEAQAHIVTAGTLQARIERVRGLAEKMKSRWLVREGE